ncbi:MAG TPA: hypothetical protein VFL82_00135 [Thermomicrobiales bacterium]|nr:hypothetical protein [Thermomicrobiales bacterium]
MVDDIVAMMRERYGREWDQDAHANVQFSFDAAILLRDIDGAHLIGEPEIDDGKVTLNIWVDFPLDDLIGADELAYEIFSRFSEDLFFSERKFELNGIRYTFVTGSAQHGHSGSLLLAGPHAADFAKRHQDHLAMDGVKFHA